MKNIQPKMEMNTIKWYSYKLGKLSELDYSKISLTPKTKNLNLEAIQKIREAFHRKTVENGIDCENCDNA